MIDKPEAVIYGSIAAIVISLFFIGTGITGYAVTSNVSGVVNVTIETAAALNFTTNLLDFGAGAITGGAVNATLDSESTTTSWSGPGTAGELVLENIGNVDVSLTLSTNKTVANFIGGSSPSFKAKTADTTGNSGACSGAVELFDGSYFEINTTPQVACTVFGYADAADEIDIDFEIVIPSDATGAKTVGIIAIGTYTP